MKNLYVITCIIIPTVLLFSCSTTKTTPEAPIAECKMGWSYDSIVESKITPRMSNANPGEFCPKGGVDAETFWLGFVKSIAKAESGWNNCEQYTESKMGTDPITGKQVVSEGLLQLSFQDARNWKSLPTCQKIDFNNPTSIFSPAINLGCGMEIMDGLLKRTGNVRKDLGAYWSTVRDKSDRMVKQMRIELPGCGL